MPPFLNSIISIISLSPLYLHNLRTTADGDSLTASAPPWSIYRRGQSTAEEQQRTQPGTPEARHTGSWTQQHPATAPPYNQEAGKRKRTRKRGGISSAYKTINNIHTEQTKKVKRLFCLLFLFL